MGLQAGRNLQIIDNGSHYLGHRKIIMTELSIISGGECQGCIQEPVHKQEEHAGKAQLFWGSMVLKFWKLDQLMVT